MRYLSPLRYPGGKARLAAFFARVAAAQEHPIDAYAEPFAGGAGAGLRLLADHHVERFLINDLNPGIAAFWRTTTREPEAFCDLIKATPITIDEWYRQHDIYSTSDSDDLALGFATFFLNRTNRSGILSGGPIGGLEQTGTWKIDARFNKEGLCERVRQIGKFGDQIKVTQIDAITFLEQLADLPDLLVYVDPPYIEQGDRLYFNTFADEQHLLLAKVLSTATFPWILTYDADDRIPASLYAANRCAEFGINHTAQVHHVGREFIVFSASLNVPDLQITRSSTAKTI